MIHVLKGSHSFTCTLRVYPLMEWTIPTFSSPDKAGTHLPTPERWKAELAWVAGYIPKQMTGTGNWTWTRSPISVGDHDLACNRARCSWALLSKINVLLLLSLEQFGRSLKTHLYRHIFGYWQLQRRVTVFSCAVHKLTYLLTFLLTAMPDHHKCCKTLFPHHGLHYCSWTY